MFMTTALNYPIHDWQSASDHCTYPWAGTNKALNMISYHDNKTFFLSRSKRFQSLAGGWDIAKCVSFFVRRTTQLCEKLYSITQIQKVWASTVCLEKNNLNFPVQFCVYIYTQISIQVKTANTFSGSTGHKALHLIAHNVFSHKQEKQLMNLGPY